MQSLFHILRQKRTDVGVDHTLGSAEQKVHACGTADGVLSYDFLHGAVDCDFVSYVVSDDFARRWTACPYRLRTKRECPS